MAISKITGASIAAGTITASSLAADTATQAELDAVSGVANAALPKAGGAMTGAITTNSTFDGVDIATVIAANTAKVTNYNQTKADIDALGIAATSVTGAQASAITANTAKVTNYNQTKADIDALGISASSITGALPAIDGGSLTGNVGKVLQVVTLSDTTRRKYTGLANGTWHSSYTALNISITPQESNSNLLVFIDLKYGVELGTHGSSYWRIKRDGVLEPTLNGPEDSLGYGCFHQARFTTSAMEYHMQTASCTGRQIAANSTATSSFTLQFRSQGATTQSINRDGSNSSDSSKGAHSPNSASSITIMEIAQ